MNWEPQNKGTIGMQSARHEVVDGKKTICKMPDLTEDSYANALKIAAAPELLAACKAARSMIEDGGWDCINARSDTHKLLDRVICKAEGRELC